MTIQELARQYADLFVTKKRDNGDTYLCIELDDKNPELMDLIRNAHDGLMPDDYKYQFIHDALEAIALVEVEDDLNNIDLEPDIYNCDLLKWVSSNLTRAAYVDDAIRDYEYDGLFNALQNGQSYEKNEVLHSVLSSLTSIIENGVSE